MSLHGATVGETAWKNNGKERKKNTKQHKLKAQSSEHTKERADYLAEKKN